MTIHTKDIPIGTLGTLELSIPVLQIESGNPGPRIVFVAGQHGNEITPLFAIQKMLGALRTNPLRKGSLHIITVANPLGMLFGVRQEPLDAGDLNRAAPGNVRKNLPNRIAAVLFDICKGADLVLDLHTFSRQCGFVGVFVKAGDATETKCREALRAIQPDCAWQIDMARGEDARFAGALDLILCRAGTPACALEMPRHLTATDAEISRIAAALLQLLGAHDMLLPDAEGGARADIPVFAATYLYANGSGIFVPARPIFSEIAAGDTLGQLFRLRTFAAENIISPVSGTLLTLRYRDFLRTGSKLGSVGVKVGVL